MSQADNVCNTWLCIPSKRPPEEAERCLKLWRDRGYKIALWRDERDCRDWPLGSATFALTAPKYPGYAGAVNQLVLTILDRHADCDWIVTGGDDVDPDLNHTAEEIARQCSEHFKGTFGVMQPTGHRWGDRQGAYIDRICGSPWIGREACLRLNKGRGPFHPGFSHMFGDQTLMEVAQKLGILWQRQDLTHFHRHWGLSGNIEDMPEFLKKWNTPEHWRESRALYERLKADNFAECMPL